MASKPIPQLRVRTEFSFKQAFGPVKRVAAALAETKCPAAAIVDGGTWGHVRWQKELAKVGVKPLFGTELVVPQENGLKPAAWALAKDTKAFYRFSTAARKPGVDIAALFAEHNKGIVRFAGTALTDPDQFDYIDLNPASLLQQRAAYALHKRTGKPMVVTSDNNYPTKADYAAFMAMVDREKVTPQHILTEAELRESIKFLSDAEFKKAIANTRRIAEACASELPTAPLIQVPGDFRALAYAGRDRRVRLGHIPKWTKEYEDRLERELVAIEAKEFQSYFLVVSELITWSKERMLVGPGRGSSAGSLLCYCIDITEVDPIPHKLLFERFIDLTRKDLPDIDIDFNDNKREQVFEYLTHKYGFNNVARLGNINTLKPRSVMMEICKRFGIPDHEKFDLLNVLIEYSSGDARYGKGLLDTLENTETGRKFAARHPKAGVMGEIENHASHTGVHAAGVIVCNDPVSDYCTIGAEGVAHLDKPDAEALNLLKIDALGLRTLGILEDAGVATNDQLYALQRNDPNVFQIFNEHRYSAVFQFEGTAQRQISSEVEIDKFETIDHLTALARPGPLGGGATQKYIERKKYNQGHSAWQMKSHEHYIEPLLRDTYGVVLYQEQVMQIVRQIGKFSWEETTTIRKAMSGRKGEEYFNQQETKFIAGAAKDGIGEHDARAIWKEICAFGAWGMNKSHTCAYAVISYWCAWMKRYHPLEYAAAGLRNAKDDDQAVAVLKEMEDEGISYIPFDPGLSEANWSVKDGKLLGGFTNIKGIGPAKAMKAIEQREYLFGPLPEGATEKELARLFKKREEYIEKWDKVTPKFTDLYPLRTAYKDMYDNPHKYGIAEGSRIVTADEFPLDGPVLWLAKLDEKKRRDEMEQRRVVKRGNRVLRGPTAFVDLVCKDDTSTPIIARIGRFEFESMGRAAIEHLVNKQDVLLMRGTRVKGFSMTRVDKIKCLNRPEIFQKGYTGEQQKT